MNNKILSQFRKVISKHRNMLSEWLSTDSRQREICLCNVENEEIEEIINKHDQVLASIDEGNFGKCTKCNGHVEIEQLELDFTKCICFDHYSPNQIQILERDLQLAANVQKHLLPQEIPEISGIKLAAFTEPAQIVGGDYFDFYKYSDSMLGIALADVMGKGLSASMLMSNLQASLRILWPEYSEFNLLAARLNELFRYNLKLVKFISLILLKIDVKSKRITYCNAGHHPPMILDTSSGSIEWLNPTGPAIGLTHTSKFLSKEVPYKEGDLLLLYTDGVVEARNKQNEEYGEERLSEFLLSNKHRTEKEILAEIRKDLKMYAETFHDDTTSIIIKL